MPETKAMGERVQAVESWIEGHERLCADRYGLLMKVIGVGSAILIAVAGFGMKSIYDRQDQQMTLLQSSVAQMTAAKR